MEDQEKEDWHPAEVVELQQHNYDGRWDRCCGRWGDERGALYVCTVPFCSETKSSPASLLAGGRGRGSSDQLVEDSVVLETSSQALESAQE